MSKSKKIFYLFVSVIITIIATRITASEIYNIIPEKYSGFKIFPLVAEVTIYVFNIFFAPLKAFSIASEEETDNNTTKHEKVKRNDNTKWIKLK